jgi:hypothetical protein
MDKPPFPYLRLVPTLLSARIGHKYHVANCSTKSQAELATERPHSTFRGFHVVEFGSNLIGDTVLGVTYHSPFSYRNVDSGSVIQFQKQQPNVSRTKRIPISVGHSDIPTKWLPEERTLTEVLFGTSLFAMELVMFIQEQSTIFLWRTCAHRDWYTGHARMNTPRKR